MRRFPFTTLVLLMTNFALPTQAADEPYKLGPDSQRQEGVPQGKVTNHEWKSQVFPGTVREYFVYVPAQYDGSKPAAVMVFQDGHNYVNEKGEFRVPIVFDNLIHQGEMPVTIGIFINPGHKGADTPKTAGRPTTAASNTTRSATSTHASCSKRSCPRSANSTS